MAYTQGVNTPHILKTRGLTKSITISGLLVSSMGLFGTGDRQDTGVLVVRYAVCVCSIPSPPVGQWLLRLPKHPMLP